MAESATRIVAHGAGALAGRGGWSLWLGAVIILLASGLQFARLGRDQRFLPDEAHFMTFARAAAVNGDWLLPGPLDKPPLSIYLSALSMAVFGVQADAAGVLHLEPLMGEFAGRLPNALLAALLTALMMRLAWRLSRDGRAAALAGLLMAASPYALAFGASAFTDMSLLFCAVLAVHLALGRRWAWAGLALGLALWCKQQALFPMALVLVMLCQDRRRASSKQAGVIWRRALPRFTLPLAISCLALLLWDLARPEASIFLQAAVNNAPAEWLAAPESWLPRLLTWLGMGLWMLGPPPVSAFLLLLAACAVARWGWTRQARLFSLALALYAALHIVFGFNLYDRYALLALPLLTLLVVGCLRMRMSRLALIPLLLGAIWTAGADLTIGGERAAYTGIDRLAAHLNSKPVASVIYDPWLGWQLGYYLGVWHDKRLVHYPTAAAWVADALALDEAGDRYFVTPHDAPYAGWLTAISDAGFAISQDYAQDRFLVFRLRPP